MPLPVLLAFSKQMRPHEEDVYHVTEILNPPQAVWLARNKDYYVPPDSIVDMHIGTSWHSKIEETKKFVKELGLQKEYIMEKKFKVPLLWDRVDERIETEMGAPHNDYEGVILTGTPDLYVKSTDTIWDYKVTKYYYTLKYMLEDKWDNDYIWQLNIYRRFNYPKAKMKLFCYLKDWKTNFPDAFGVDKTMIVEVPHIPDREVESRVKSSLAEHVKAQKDGNPRPCTDEERWRNANGVCLRCEHYCGVSRICPQNNGG
jgi:hypothetical protein